MPVLTGRASWDDVGGERLGKAVTEREGKIAGRASWDDVGGERLSKQARAVRVAAKRREAKRLAEIRKATKRKGDDVDDDDSLDGELSEDLSPDDVADLLAMTDDELAELGHNRADLEALNVED